MRRKARIKEQETSYKEQTDKLNEQTQKYTALDRQFKEKVVLPFSLMFSYYDFISSPEPLGSQGELIGWP